MYTREGRERTKDFDRKRDALAWESLEREKERRRHSGDQITLAEFFDEKKDKYFEELTPASVATYRSNLKRVLGDLGHVPLRQIDDRLIRRLQERWNARLSNDAVRTTRSALARILNKAVEDGLLDSTRSGRSRHPDQDRARPIGFPPWIRSR
ncbi:phage integrase SAM-like domain-containing protein [Naumannella halotolerans]|uniref:phage integrase SAM-like domain-containing protein n=1 Tax=Naumannella halotolerans TaxID=993414 RepID=UPI00106207BF|nr:phage integrase SAM-like domain-containing protein [Naumannella halotolerans]